MLVRQVPNMPAERVFFCPACECQHWIRCHGLDERNILPAFTFNGDDESPTFEEPIDLNGPKGRCVSRVTDGRITYDDASEHDFAGQTIDLPDVTTWSL